ncbi:DUF4873 domain-containing protein [Dactylosporangium aurantiacum]|uniref:DUF4873 domain-containing protein n=1 Tax=Dactylosporangium aurantiacum TaxID=35754 RepID=A0A9Q9IC39_9ACTN|nr:DUF4873 domain-containing protein [Dactylosporangium aurantiacum]MDG6102711.1 DUF4873 domain-containing protein [Dactylosporangium aurantiacum]UWZ53041.1 DUF4873 domain-containing protein [Dactylosporangium aurantiacum]
MPEEPRPVKAELLVDGAVHAVRLHLSGHFQPLDGRYHWGGRMSGDPAVPALVRAGRRDVLLRCGPADPVPARLLEIDPWGNVRFGGTGAPPDGVR